MKKRLLLMASVVLTLLSVHAQKAEFFSPNGKAINGYDVVAFFKASKPMEGNKAFTYVWREATWWFSSSENLELFKRNPEQYAPQYGGYCAYGMSEGHKAPTEIETWKILNNKLYFNYNQQVQKIWNKDIPGHIQQADKNWDKIKSKE